MSKRKKQKRTQAAKSARPSSSSPPSPSTPPSKRQQRRERQQRDRRNRHLGLIVVVVLLAAAVVAVFAIQWGGGSSAAALELDDPALGPADAPVTIVEFGDFGCPSCRAWHNSGIREAIMAQYGDRVRFVWKDFPVITPQSPRAAEAGQCAGAQGKFWEYHDYLYENLRGLGEQDLLGYAAAVGLDETAFSACLEDNLTRQKVQDNLAEARRQRARGTPSFVVDGELLPGPPSFQQLEQLIQAAS